MNKSYAKVTIILWSTVGLIAIICLIGGIFGNRENRSNNDGNSMVAFFNMSKSAYGGDVVERKLEVITSDIDTIDIEWGEGQVEIFESDTNDIKLIQHAPEDMPDNKLMRVNKSHNELTISDSQIRRKNSRFSLGTPNISKTYLEVYLPKKYYREIQIDGISCSIDAQNLNVDDLEIDTVSGNVNVSGTFKEISMNSVSGHIKGSDITAKKIDLDSVSGNIDVDGAFSEIDVTLVAGSSNITSSTMIDRFESDSASGSSTLSIPENDGFTVYFSKLSGRFNSDFDTTKSENKYTYKNGNARFEIGALSGNVNINRN